MTEQRWNNDEGILVLNEQGGVENETHPGYPLSVTSFVSIQLSGEFSANS